MAGARWWANSGRSAPSYSEQGCPCGVGQVPGGGQAAEGLHLLPVREVSVCRHVASAHSLRGGETTALQEI